MQHPKVKIITGGILLITIIFVCWIHHPLPLYQGELPLSGLKSPVDVFTDEFKYDNCDTIKFEFSTFSDDAYKYYNSLSEQRDKGELDIFGGEVVPVYTNVTNGLGILISKNAQEIYIKP